MYKAVPGRRQDVETLLAIMQPTIMRSHRWGGDLNGRSLALPLDPGGVPLVSGATRSLQPRLLLVSTSLTYLIVAK